ncbi:unnamed protein product [Clonostachys rosea f. rosea IK726]|uniref:Uncharacterized protein n=1 Tax=Clonostachys rosea f. rosea IK726 TaxID=1349383 RepID=A0ACA9TV76_BIOOC|nr:unnamed protein product [Clonostachys rosea f. rosea IK726]
MASLDCHARAFFKDFNEAIDYGRNYFGGSDTPFSVTVGGVQIYICCAPEDVARLYRNTTTISYQHVVEDMYRGIGFTGSAFNKMFHIDPSAKHNIGMSHPLPPCHMIVEYHRRQLKSGEPTDELLQNRVRPGIDRRLQGVVEGTSFSIIGSSGCETTVSLLKLCTDLFLHSAATAYLGQKIWHVNPKFLDYFEVWERESWKYMFKMPAFMSRDMIWARDGIINTFAKYLSIPAEARSDCSDFVRSVEVMLRDVGLAEQDMAKVFLLYFWAILGNVYKAAFWTMAHIVYDETLSKSIRAELLPAYREGRVDTSYLFQCPLLESLINEVLRLAVATALLRDVISPTTLRDVTIPPGSKVPYRQLHRNQDVWGTEPLVLDPARFQNNPKLLSSKSFRPFGGGQTLCPGRVLAKQSIKYTVASLLMRFDLEIDVEMTRKAVGGDGSKPNFTQMDSTKPSPVASLPVQGQDVYLGLKEKGHSK